MMTYQGRLVTDQGLFRPMTGYGQFVPLPPFPPVLYDKVSLLLIMGDLIFLLKSSPSPSNKIREKKEFGSVCPVPRTEEDMATTNGVDQEIPPEVGIIWPMLEMICWIWYYGHHHIAKCVLCSIRCPCIFYDPVSDAIRRRVGYRGMFWEEGVDTGAYFRGNYGSRVWKSQKYENMYFPHTQTNWDKYMFNGIPKIKF